MVGSADVRVKIYTLPNGVEPSSCQLSLARENYQARTAATKHPSAGRRSHTRTRVCFTPGTNSAIATKPPTALELLLPQRREPRKCSCSTQKRRAFPGLLELVLALDCREIWLLNKRYIFWLSVSHRLSRGFVFWVVAPSSSSISSLCREITSRDIKACPSLARPLRPSGAAPNATLRSLHLAGLRRGLAG